jgi:mRNA interferase YafQ
MRHTEESRQFRRDIQRAEARSKNLAKLFAVVDMLARDIPLPARCRPHLLRGDWTGHWECHIEPDWLLIYQLTDDAVILVRTGSHSDLFA